MTPDCRSECSLKIILENLGFQLSVVTLGSECHRAILSENGIRWRLWLQEWMPLCRAEWKQNQLTAVTTRMDAIVSYWVKTESGDSCDYKSGCHCVILSENGIRWQLWLQDLLPHTKLEIDIFHFKSHQAPSQTFVSANRAGLVSPHSHSSKWKLIKLY